MSEENSPRAYVADPETKWVPLSELHVKYMERIEEYLSRYIQGEKNVPKIAIVGPYGQGKTQLLFHILSKAFDRGGIALYTHADIIVKLIKQQFGQTGKILPSDLPGYLKKAILNDVENIRLDKRENLLLVHPDLVERLRESLSNVDANGPLVLLIDELEQSYELLQSKIESNDRNPIRGLLDSREIYTVLAFAPKSIYEYKIGAALGEGEAERRRLDVFNLPPISPNEIKKFLKIDEKGFANLIWWLSRGRVGLAIKAFNNSRNYSLVEQAGFLSFVESLGQTSGVPCIDIDAFLDKQGNFLRNWNQILKITPSMSVPEEEWALIFSIDRELYSRANDFFGKLGFSGKHSMVLSNFLRLLLEAISGADSKAVVKKKDSVPLLRATYELVLEHTYDDDFISVLQKKLDYLQSDPDLKFILPDKMEESKIVERVKSSGFLPFDFEILLELFPFPLSSPQLPGTSEKEVNKWLQQTENHPLAEDEEGSVHLLFFRDSEHFKEYCENSRRLFVEKALPEDDLTNVILLYGEASTLPAMAQWLKKQGRLYVEKLRPSLLTGFLVNALYLTSKSTGSYPSHLRKELENLKTQFGSIGDRATVRKIQHYLAGLNDFVASAAQSFGVRLNRFAYERKGAGFEEQFERHKSSVGFAYPFMLAFFQENMDTQKALAQVRIWSERTEDPLQEFLPEIGGFRTAVRFLPIERKGGLQHSESVAVVRDFYRELIDDLDELADLLPKDEFTMLVDDDLSKFLLGAFYDARRFSGVSDGDKKRLIEYLSQSSETQRKTLEQEQILKESISIGLENSLKFSPEQEQAIQQLLSIVTMMDSWHSNVYKQVFFLFAEQISIAIKQRADGFWKSLNELPSIQYKELKELKQLFLLLEVLPEGVFRFLGKSRDEFAKALEKMKEEACNEMSKEDIAGIDKNNIIRVHEFFSDLIDLQENLGSIRSTFDWLQSTLQEYNKVRKGE